MLLSLRKQQLRQWDRESWYAYFWTLPLSSGFFQKSNNAALFLPSRRRMAYLEAGIRAKHTPWNSWHPLWPPEPGKGESIPKCQWWRAHGAAWMELEGQQRFGTGCRSKQDILDTHTILHALNLFETALHLRGLPTSNAQLWKRWGNLSHLSGKGGYTRQTKPVRSQALALLSVPSSQCKFGVKQGKASMYKSEPRCENWTQPRLSFSVYHLIALCRPGSCLSHPPTPRKSDTISSRILTHCTDTNVCKPIPRPPCSTEKPVWFNRESEV